MLMDNLEIECTFTGVLEFYYGLRRSANYDIQVLATALNQYLHEVFEQLDFANCGVVNREDFIAFLHSVSLVQLANNVNQCAQKKLTFRAFHEYIGAYYSLLAGRAYVPFDCGNTEQEYKESLKSLWTIGRTTKSKECQCHSMNSTGLNPFTSTPTGENRSFLQVTPIASLRRKECVVCSRCRDGNLQTISESIDSDELDNLREVIEELRMSLQSKDAKIMRLQVQLQKVTVDDSTELTLCASSHSSSPSSGISSSDTDEMKTVNYVHDLQIELKATRKKLYAITQQNKSLVYYVEKMADTFERTKSAILSSLSRVRNLETQAKESTQLESRVLELQIELEKSRKCVKRNSVDLNSSGGSDVSMEEKKDESSFDDCISRVEDLLIAKLQEQIAANTKGLEQLRKEKLSLQNYVNKLRCGRENMAHDLKATESERVRLSIVEEKLIDVVGILRHLRKMMMPRATIGNLLIQAIEHLAPDDVIAEDEVVQFVTSFLRKLTAYELTFSQPTAVCKWVTYV